MSKAKPDEKLDFEASVQKLDHIVQELESPQIPLERAIELTRLLGDPDLDFAERARLELESSQIFVEASQNLVLKLMRRAINTQFLQRFSRMHEAMSRPPRDAQNDPFRDLIRSLEERDAERAASVVYSGMERIHEHWLRILAEATEQTHLPDQPPRETLK